MGASVLVTDYPWPDLNIERNILAQADLDLREPEVACEEGLVRAVQDVSAIMTCWAPLTRRVIEAAAKCRHIARLGIGLDNIDVQCASERGMLVTRVPDYCVEELAEHALALIMGLARNIGAYHQQTKSGRYDINEGATPVRIAGKTLGVIGFGRSGRRLAQMASALGMRVLVYSRRRIDPSGAGLAAEWRPLDAVLEASDFVSIQCPLTEQTHHLIGERELRRMKRTAYLVNVARGPIVDCQALADALQRDEIAGAGLDVQEPEPPDLDKPPYNDPRVIVTPHAAFLSPLSVEELRTRVATQVVDFYQGRAPEHMVNADVLAKNPPVKD